MVAYETVAGDEVVCADGVPLGTVEADEGSHLRLRRDGQPALVWVPKRLIAGHGDGVVRLLLNRDELHDGYIGLPPARQREYGTLEAITFALRQAHHRRAV